MDESERRLLGTFLQRKRGQLRPDEVGLGVGGRRRTPGLRREEVAALAGVSVTWYTWIEQGRRVSASASVLESIARALRLAPHERAYVLGLAGMRGDTPAPAAPEPLSPALEAIVQHQGHYPAYLMSRAWDLLAWNRAAAAVFGDFGALPPDERNMVYYTVVRPEARARVVDWPLRAQRLVAEFRADCGRYLGDPQVAALVERLHQASPDFPRWWAAHEVQQREGGRRAFEHPQLGRLVLEQTTLRPSHAPDLKLVIHVPADEHASAAKLRALHQQPAAEPERPA
jgi:transcriptional regulator with XRE-family HTH domain